MRGNSFTSAPPEKLPSLPVITSAEKSPCSSSGSRRASDSSAVRPNTFGRPGPDPSSIVTSASVSMRSSENCVTGSATKGGYLSGRVKMLAGSALVLLALAGGCGGSSSGSGGANTEAEIMVEPAVPIEAVLKMCRDHGVRLTQAVSRTPVNGESRTTGVMVYPNMSDEEIMETFRQAGRRGETVLIDNFFISGEADALQAFEEEPSVKTVFLKPDTMPPQ